MMRGWIALAIVSGCSSVVPEPAVFGACFTGYGEPYQPVSESARGWVAEVGVGEPPYDCFTGEAIRSTSDVDPAAAGWIRVADMVDAEWVIGVVFPDGPGFDGVAVGDEVVAEMAYTFGGFGPDIGSVDVRTPDGANLAYVAVGGEVADLPGPADLTVALGDAVGGGSDGCGSWQSYDLEVNGEVLGYGEQLEIAGHDVFHGGVDLQDDPTSGCPDWYVAHAALASR
ncbi:MAG: hypothetical protein ABMA64_09550 [Myxococcota bacterium]